MPRVTSTGCSQSQFSLHLAVKLKGLSDRDLIMGSAALAISYVLVTGTQFTAGAPSKRNDNAAFFKGPFTPCKGSRPQNAVEFVQSHAFATRLFNEIGIKKLIIAVAKYRVPSEFVYSLCDFACRFALFAYTALSGGNLILPARVSAAQAFEFVERFFAAIRIATPAMVFRNGKRKCYLPWSAVEEGMDMVFPGILNILDGDIPRDANMMLHFVLQVRKIML